MSPTKKSSFSKQHKQDSLGSRSPPGAVHRVLRELAPNHLTIKQSDLARMREPVLTPEQAAAARRAAALEHERSHAAAEQRRAAMLQMERERSGEGQLTEEETAQAAADAVVRDAAALKRLEQSDEAKRMNQMVLRSQCMAIREQQMLEKRALKDREAASSREADMSMERERQRAVLATQAREAHEADVRKQGAAMLAEQLAEHELQKMLEEERLEAEKERIVMDAQRAKQEEAAAAQRKKEAAAALMRSVAAANAELLERKKADAAQQAAEDRRIAAYLAGKAARDQAFAEEKARQAHERELEVARLRAAQEKILDRRSEMDELRACRAQAEADRQWQAKEQAGAARKAAVQADLNEARARQAADRAAAAAAAAEAARRDAAAQSAFAQHALAAQECQAKEAEEAKHRHAMELRRQIEAGEARTAQKRAAARSEGAAARAAEGARQALVEALRQRKLKELEAAGVPSKYCAELATKAFVNVR
ncbi:g13486 [Coccomyxa viridis]|uniref:Cilia- and flagella-associated protein 45 n=1 Tax=Coccomyxa viridis TaxID=1274662 RepID=A0ABP1GCW1_9CHLO